MFLTQPELVLTQTDCIVCYDESEVFICNPGASQVQPGQRSGHSDWATNWKINES
jgi:hypothetical protein